MVIEGMDAAVLIEGGGFTPQVAAPEEAEAAPTVQAALQEAGRLGGRAAALEAAAGDDLWVTDAMRCVDRTAHFPAPLAPVAAGPDGTASEADAGQDHPLVKEKLSFAEMGHLLASRQFDSTDYYWEEMSTGDYEWADKNFKQDVYSGVERATAGATSQQEANQLAQAYLESLGLGSLVHLNNPTSGSDQEIVVTAQTYHGPTVYMPVLWMGEGAFNDFDPALFNFLDSTSHAIAVDPDVVLTPEAVEALDHLQTMVGRVTTYLNSLPPGGVVMTTKGLFTVAELRAVWALADFHITKAGTPYEANGIPGHPGAGAAHYNDGNPILETNITNLISFMHDPDRALFYILHELGHVTALGYQELLTIRPPGSPPPSNEVFGPSERFFNDFAQFMADLMGHPLPAGFDPNEYAFSADPQMTFVSDSQSGGTGGGENGGHGNVPQN